MLINQRMCSNVRGISLSKFILQRSKSTNFLKKFKFSNSDVCRSYHPLGLGSRADVIRISPKETQSSTSPIYTNLHRSRQFPGRYFSSKETDSSEPPSRQGFIEYEQDFFGEPVSFLGEHDNENENEYLGIKIESNAPNTSAKIKLQTEAMVAFDTHVIQMLSKGRASSDGGDEFGLSIKASHSSAITWAELIRHASSWCRPVNEDGASAKRICDAPLLVHAAFSPLLVAGGAAYLMNLDQKYFKLKGKNSICVMVQAAIDRRNDERLSRREMLHLWAMHYLFLNEHEKALNTLGQMLESCPGDALGLSLALDLAQVLGDKKAALRLASSVTSYWNERGQRDLTGQTAQAGHSMGTSLIASGFAIGGRTREAEQLADKSLSRDSTASGIAAAALAHIYYAEGRSSEGNSLFTGHGVEYYESCGFLFYGAQMSALGSRFSMDSSGASADRVALRLYDESFGDIFEYSAYDGKNNLPMVRRIPSSQKRILMESASGAASSFFGQMFGSDIKEKNENQTEEVGEEDTNDDGIIADSESRTVEDVLTWLPPTTSILVDATMLLSRLTISGVIFSSDTRWKALRSAWTTAIYVENSFFDAKEAKIPSSCERKKSHSLLADVFSCLCIGPELIQTNNSDRVSGKIGKALCLMGSLMRVNGVTNVKKSQDVVKKEWADVVHLLYEAKTGWELNVDNSNSSFRQPRKLLTPDLVGFDMSFDHFIEHAICHAALNSENYESLCIARSLCSESVALRSNSPEHWHRYGTVLEKLGDDENARNAFHASISLGSGEGGHLGGQQ